jgi:predicted MPP superfamily phosphohydrolase
MNALQKPWKRLIRVGLLAVCGVLLLVVRMLSDDLAAPLWAEDGARVLYRIAYFIMLPVWMLITGITTPLSNFGDHWSTVRIVGAAFLSPFLWYGFVVFMIRAAHKVGRVVETAGDPLERDRDAKKTWTRREWLGVAGGGAVIAAGGGLATYGVLIEPQRIRVARFNLPVPDLPETFDGLRVVQIADTHYGPFVSLRYIRSAVEQANALEPDLVLLTGDYCHRTEKSIDPGIEVMRHIKPRLGMAAVLGNHDHWEGADLCRAAFGNLGVPMLDNARRFLTPDGFRDVPDPGRSICVGGVGDFWEDAVDFRAATANAPENMPRLVMSHNPDTAEVSIPADTRIDLMFSGHTHGGQVRLPVAGTPAVPSFYGSKYAGGFVEGPRCPVVVSRGVGLSVMPVRFQCRPDIVEVTLART